MGYMWLTGATRATVAYCLVNTPEMLISDEKRKLMYKMGALTTESPEYVTACEELERNMVYDDIPLNKRVFTFDVLRDNDAIESIKIKVEKAREFLTQIDAAI